MPDVTLRTELNARITVYRAPSALARGASAAAARFRREPTAQDLVEYGGDRRVPGYGSLAARSAEWPDRDR